MTCLGLFAAVIRDIALDKIGKDGISHGALHYPFMLAFPIGKGKRREDFIRKSSLSSQVPL